MSGDPVLNRRLILESRQDVADGMGGFTVTWVPGGALWAQVRVQSAGENKIGARDVSSVAYRITLRSNPPGSPARPKPDQRFREFERVFNIKAVSEWGSEGRFLECWAEEGRA